jgi:hypothetical protein
VDKKSGKKGPPLTASELYGGIAVEGLGSPAKIKKLGTTNDIYTHSPEKKGSVWLDCVADFSLL